MLALFSLLLLCGAEPRPEPLAFGELFEAGPRELQPSPKLLSLNGKRVKMVGFMAQMEIPLRGAFYLAPRPLSCDESGGGIGDLPPEAVRVVVRSHSGKVVPFVRGPLEVTGVLEVGYRAEQDGEASSLRLILDQQKDREVGRRNKQAKRPAEKTKTSTAIANP